RRAATKAGRLPVEPAERPTAADLDSVRRSARGAQCASGPPENGPRPSQARDNRHGEGIALSAAPEDPLELDPGHDRPSDHKPAAVRRVGKYVAEPALDSQREDAECEDIADLTIHGLADGGDR